MIAALGPWFSKLVQPYVPSASPAGLAVASASFRPTPAASLEARGGVAVAGLALVLFLLWRWVDDTPAAVPGRPAAALPVGIPLAVVAAMVAANVRPTFEWSRGLDAFRESVNTTSGITDEPAVLTRAKRGVISGWTSSSLSLVVRNDPSSGLHVDRDPVIIPFPPADARRQFADSYD